MMGVLAWSLAADFIWSNDLHANVLFTVAWIFLNCDQKHAKTQCIVSQPLGDPLSKLHEYYNGSHLFACIKPSSVACHEIQTLIYLCQFVTCPCPFIVCSVKCWRVTACLHVVYNSIENGLIMTCKLIQWEYVWN